MKPKNNNPERRCDNQCVSMLPRQLRDNFRKDFLRNSHPPARRISAQFDYIFCPACGEMDKGVPKWKLEGEQAPFQFLAGRMVSQY